jgi:hypothetical protein
MRMALSPNNLLFFITATNITLLKGYLNMAYYQRSGGRPGGARTSTFNRGRSRGGSRGPAKKYINPSKFITEQLQKPKKLSTNQSSSSRILSFPNNFNETLIKKAI